MIDIATSALLCSYTPTRLSRDKLRGEEAWDTEVVTMGIATQGFKAMRLRILVSTLSPQLQQCIDAVRVDSIVSLRSRETLEAGGATVSALLQLS